MGTEAYRRIREAVMNQADRACAIQSLRFLHSTGYGSRYQPNEEEIASFVRAMHIDPKVVPSFDPSDP